MPTSTSSTPGGGSLRKKESAESKQKGIIAAEDNSKATIRNRSASEDFKSNDDKKKKPFLSPKLLVPNKKNLGGEEPPISKTLDSRMKSNPYIKKFKLPTTETLVNDYSAALFRQILLHEIIQIKDIITMKKKSKKFQFPVGIEIAVGSQKLCFASFVSRDKTFNDLMNSWREVTGESHEDASSHSVDDEMEDDQIPNSVFEETSNEPSPILLSANGGGEGHHGSAGTKSDSKSSNGNVGKVEEKSAFEELYGNYEQYLSATEQSSILESQSSEFQELLSENFNVSVINFFRALCSDQCGFESAYHTKRGDKSVVVKNWAHRERFGTVREVEYVAPVNSPIGPDKTRIQETQRYHLTRIEAKWEVTETSAETCRLTIVLCVRFIKKTWFKNKIETTTIKESKGSFTQWVTLAKQEIQKMMQLRPKAAVPQSLSNPSLGRSVDKKIEQLKNDEGDSPKPHHTRSRSRQHLVSSSGQVPITSPTSPGNNTASLHTPNSSSNNIPTTNMLSSSQQSTPTTTGPNLMPSSGSFASEFSSSNKPEFGSTPQSSSSFQLSISSKFGSVQLSGLVLLSFLMFAIALYFYLYMKISTLNSKIETMETIFSNFVQMNNQNNQNKP
eukprot:gene19490-23350_t